MTRTARIGAAFVASLVAAGLVQQASMAVAQVREPIEALLPLGLMVLLLTAIVALVVWRRPAAIDFAAGVLLTLLVVIGAGAYLLGRAVLTPGVKTQIFRELRRRGVARTALNELIQHADENVRRWAKSDLERIEKAVVTQPESQPEPARQLPWGILWQCDHAPPPGLKAPKSPSGCAVCCRTFAMR